MIIFANESTQEPTLDQSFFKYRPHKEATSSGLLGMELQGAMAIFALKLKRILKLTD